MRSEPASYESRCAARGKQHLTTEDTGVTQRNTGEAAGNVGRHKGMLIRHETHD
jgi:hypothetical protein